MEQLYKKLHYYSGLILSTFILLHLVNHLCVFAGPDEHIHFMTRFRLIYRHPIVESLLLLAVASQIPTGWLLYRRLRQKQAHRVERLQIISGLYLAVFLIIHVSAVLTGRLLLQLDTNLYYAAVGMNTFPFSLFFIPYYLLSVIAVFTHIACIHHKAMHKHFPTHNPSKQSVAIGALGCILALMIVYAMTIYQPTMHIPPAYYKVLGR